MLLVGWVAGGRTGCSQGALIFAANALGNGGIRDYDRCFEH